MRRATESVWEGSPGAQLPTALQGTPQCDWMLGSGPEGGVHGAVETRISRFETCSRWNPAGTEVHVTGVVEDLAQKVAQVGGRNAVFHKVDSEATPAGSSAKQVAASDPEVGAPPP